MNSSGVAKAKHSEATAVTPRMEMLELGEGGRSLFRILIEGDGEIAKGKGRELATVIAVVDRVLREVDV